MELKLIMLLADQPVERRQVQVELVKAGGLSGQFQNCFRGERKAVFPIAQHHAVVFQADLKFALAQKDFIFPAQDREQDFPLQFWVAGFPIDVKIAGEPARLPVF